VMVFNIIVSPYGFLIEGETTMPARYGPIVQG